MSKNATVVIRPDPDTDAKHFDMPNKNSKPSDHHASFCDPWIMAHRKCLSQGLGDFEHFGSMLSGNHDLCQMQHPNHPNNGTCSPLHPTPSELKAMKATEALVKKQEEEKAADKGKAQVEEERKGLMEEPEPLKMKMNKTGMQLKGSERKL